MNVKYNIKYIHKCLDFNTYLNIWKHNYNTIRSAFSWQDKEDTFIFSILLNFFQNHVKNKDSYMYMFRCRYKCVHI